VRSQRFSVQTSPLKTQSSNSTLSYALPPPLSFQPSPLPVESQSLQTSSPHDAFFSAYSNNASPSSTFNPLGTTPSPSHDSRPWPTEQHHHNPTFATLASGFDRHPQPPSFQPVQLPQQYQNYQPHPLPAYPQSQGGYQHQSTFSRGTTVGGGGGAGRSGLPQEWLAQGTGLPQRPPSAGGWVAPQRGASPGYAALMGARMAQEAVAGGGLAGRGPRAHQASVSPGPDDEVIPTAIVIKSIPFACPKEILLSEMEALGLPPPFAFNYHYDNGQFRGLAFANYATEEQAAVTVQALQGFELQGRKLRTEFKKVLKEGEKEKIERDKAVRRMRSMGMTVGGAGDYRQQPQPPPQQGYSSPVKGGWDRRAGSQSGQQVYGGYAPQTYQAGWRGHEEQEDYGRLVNGQFSSAFGHQSRQPSYSTFSIEPFGPQPTLDNFGSPPSDPGTSISSRMPTSTTTASSSDVPQTPGLDCDSSDGLQGAHLDLNEAQSLEIYSRVLIFKDDSLRDELSFARTLGHAQRRIVHLVARKLALESRSVGQGDDRHVIVYKSSARPNSLAAPAASKALRHSASTLGRQTQPAAFLSPEASLPPVSLRGKKSMPDFRTPGGAGLFARHSSHSLRGTLPSKGSGGGYTGGIFASGFFDGPQVTEEDEAKWRSSGASPVGTGSPSLSVTPAEGDDAASAVTTSGNGNGVMRMPKGPGDGGWWGAGVNGHE